jgi:hypothetical protein
LLDVFVAKIQAIYTGEKEAKKADSNTAYGLKAYILLAWDVQVILTANLQTEIGLVNSSTGTIQDIIFQEDQESPSFPISVLISFDNYKDLTIASLEGERVVPISPIRHTWNSKFRASCSRLQIPVCLA